MSRLQVRGLGVAFAGRSAVRDLELDLEPGEILGLVGPSGSGKSQALRAMIGLSPPDAVVCGSVRLDGRELVGLDERALCGVRGRGLALVFQEPSTALDPVMPIGEQVAEGLRLQGLERRAARQEAARWLARVGLEQIPPGRRPHQLSGGQRQRAAIAAAAALRPAVLLADEPTTALDPATQAGIAALLARLAREDGMALVLVSHDLALVAGLADRIAVLDAGRQVASGPAREVLTADAPDVGRPHAAGRAPSPPNATPTDAAVVLEARGLRRTYAVGGGRGARAGLEAADLTLRRGEALAVVGATGAGKSTLLRLVLGLERPEAGEVRLAGELFSPAPEARQRALRRRIQPVFQDPAGSFDPRWTAARIVAEPLGLISPRLSPMETERRTMAALARVGLSPEQALRPARALSGGQRQRLALARALVVGPQVLVLDEATSALDAGARGEVLALLAELKGRDGLACLLVTHDLAVVRALADRVAVLDAGRIVEQGPVAERLASPQHPATRALVAASPDLDTVIAARWGAAEPFMDGA